MNEQVDEVLQRLVNDEGFRQEFETDRESVLKRFTLSALQVAALLALNLPTLVAAASALRGASGSKPV